MPRARNLKPGFFRDAVLVEMPFETRLLFAGLWTLADRRGKLEDKPKQIKMEIFPADSVDVDSMMNVLHQAGRIIRYVIDGKAYCKISNFSRHQNPHRDERESEIPEPLEHTASTVQTLCNDTANRADSLNLTPDCLNLISDSPIPETFPKSKPLRLASQTAPKEKKHFTSDETALQEVCRNTWAAYAKSYADRYGTAPTRNSRVSSMVKQFCQRVPAAEAPGIAAFFLTHNAGYYVSKMHAVGPMLADAEKLRTEWITKRTVTSTEANQSDRTQANGNVWNRVISSIEAEEKHEAVR